MWKEAVKPTVYHHHLLLRTPPRAFRPLSSPRFVINVLWLSDVEILAVFFRVGKVSIPTVYDVSCPCLGMFTLLILCSSLLHLLRSWGSPFLLFLPFTLYSHTFSHFVLCAQILFPRGICSTSFQISLRSPPFYEPPRYKLDFFFSSGVHRQSLPLCLKWSLGLTTKWLPSFTKVMYIYMNCPFVLDAVRSSSQVSSLEKKKTTSKTLMKKWQF